MSQRIATGVYLVTQHISDKASIKVSLRMTADELVSVVYITSGDVARDSMYSVVSITDKISSFISIARSAGFISEVNSLLLEREVLKLGRLASTLVVRDDGHGLTHLTRDRSDVRLKMLDLFGDEAPDARKPKLKMSDRNTHAVPVVASGEVDDRVIATAQESRSVDNYRQEKPVPKEKEKDTSFDRVDITNSAEMSVVNMVAIETPPMPAEAVTMKTDDSAIKNVSQDVFTDNVNRAPVFRSSVSTNETANGIAPHVEARRKQVLRYIRENGIVSIKDISDSVAGVSEKTLQRTLIDLVAEGAVVRHGDRRWSRYEAIV